MRGFLGQELPINVSAYPDEAVDVITKDLDNLALFTCYISYAHKTEAANYGSHQTSKIRVLMDIFVLWIFSADV